MCFKLSMHYVVKCRTLCVGDKHKLHLKTLDLFLLYLNAKIVAVDLSAMITMLVYLLTHESNMLFIFTSFFEWVFNYSY